MPIVNVSWKGHQDKNVKADLFDFTADLINRETGTRQDLIYVFIREMEEENVRNDGTVVLIDWTIQPARTPAAKKAIMVDLTDKIQSITGENKDDIVIIFRDIPLNSASVGGITREERL